jgi:hypothetical protein
MNLAYHLIAVSLACPSFLFAQDAQPSEQQRAELTALIDQYSQARENRDTVLLKRILTADIDQLVSTGEWRTGIRAAVQGMLTSSTNNPGDRRLIVEKIKVPGLGSAIVDCRYEIKTAGGTTRRMWSTFIVVSENQTWKISAIRNMLPAGQ